MTMSSPISLKTTLANWIVSPDARLTVCGNSKDTLIIFLDCKCLIEHLTTLLAAEYVSNPETYLNQVLPTCDTVDLK